jgi:hypothetical protein
MRIPPEVFEMLSAQPLFSGLSQKESAHAISAHMQHRAGSDCPIALTR